MVGTMLAWLIGGALGGLLAGSILRKTGYALVGDTLLGTLAGALGGLIVVTFEGLASLQVVLASVAVAILAGLLQILLLYLLDDERRPARR